MHRRRFIIPVLIVLIVTHFSIGSLSNIVAAPDLASIVGSFGIGDRNYDMLPILVGLADASGYFSSDPIYTGDKADQILARVTGTATGGSYTLVLPDTPSGRLINRIDGSNAGSSLKVFDIRLLSDTTARGYMASDEDMLASSVRLSGDRRVQGGILLVWAADNKQTFPHDFGKAHELFTSEADQMSLAAGWSLINLNTRPFQVTSQTAVDLIPADIPPTDYSNLSCNDFLPQFLDQAQQNYSFTQLHHVDWTALRAKLLPLAKDAKTVVDCQQVIRTLANSIPDGHLNFNLPGLMDEWMGNLGLLLGQTSDNQVVVIFSAPNTPAGTAGIKPGASIAQWNGKSILEALAAQVFQFANASTVQGQQDLRLILLPTGTVDSKVTLTYQNPGDAPATATLARARIPPMRFGRPILGLQDDRLPTGFGFIRIDNFLDGSFIAKYDQIVNKLMQENVPGIIIDVRANPGGLSSVMEALASRFFDKDFILGKQFTRDNRLIGIVDVYSRAPIYKGCVAILIDANTSSAGDLFAYSFKLSKRGILVGQTSSAGNVGTVGGGQYILPGNGNIQFSTGGLVDDQGNFILEGVGVAPDVLVPTTIQSLLPPNDDVLTASIQALQNCKAANGS